MQFQHTPPVFDYRALRLMLGIIAFLMPWLVTSIAQSPLPSISASYFTEARDYFVGLLFVVGGLMLAYNGHTSTEAWASKAAAIAALLIALYPTAKDSCESSMTSTVHGAAAVALFAILTYFCFGPFRRNTKGQGGKKGVRAKLYFLCGSVMAAALVTGLAGQWLLACELVARLNLIFWVEAVALTAFGVAWIVAGKIIPLVVDDDEALRVFRH